ncbi:uncharacterized protein A4U43_C03F4310 [Asparagus officinalis]|uniref:VQ domain-containing protein n=1 Tax=Asparagus officinalis TaxID=4686 RepID=A0A5P1F7A4_ASPOF|nr:uncharacterized protein A4U43_C03F4310 [Asparagus officinalis]
MPSSKRALQDPVTRPSPLKVSKDYFKAKKITSQADLRSAVIVHVHSPKVIHARPQDFMRVVQMLTGRSSSFSSTTSSFSFVAGQNDERPRANTNTKEVGGELKIARLFYREINTTPAEVALL